MKNLKLMIIVLLCSITMNLLAEEKRFTIEGETYIFDSNTGQIRNAKNVIRLSVIKCKYYSSDIKKSFFYPMIVKAFTKEQVKYLAEENFSILLEFFCDSFGQIKEQQCWRAYNGKSTMIEPSTKFISEFFKFDKATIGSMINLSTACPNQKYYQFFMVIRFEQVYEWLIQQQ